MISYHCYEQGDLPIHQIGPIVLNVVLAAFGDDASALAGQALCFFLHLTPCDGVGFCNGCWPVRGKNVRIGLNLAKDEKTAK